MDPHATQLPELLPTLEESINEAPQHEETMEECRPGEASAALPMPEPVLPGTTPIGVPATPALNIGRCSPPHTPVSGTPLASHANLLNVAPCQSCSPQEHLRHLKRGRHEPECSDAGACTDGHASDDSSTTAGEASQASLGARRPRLRSREGAAAYGIGTSAAGVGPASGVQDASPIRHGIGSLLAHASDCVANECGHEFQVHGRDTPRDDDEQRGDGDRGADRGAQAEKLTGAAAKYWLGSLTVASQQSERRDIRTPDPGPPPNLLARVSSSLSADRGDTNGGSLHDTSSLRVREGQDHGILSMRQRNGAGSDAAADSSHLHRLPAPALTSPQHILPSTAAMPVILAHGVQSDQHGQQTAGHLTATGLRYSMSQPSQPAMNLGNVGESPMGASEASPRAARLNIAHDPLATTRPVGAVPATQMSEVLSIRGVDSPSIAAHVPLCQLVAPSLIHEALDAHDPPLREAQPAQPTGPDPLSSAPFFPGTEASAVSRAGTGTGPVICVPPPLPQPAPVNVLHHGRRLVEVAEESLGAARVHSSQGPMTNRSFWDCSFKADSQGQRSSVSERNHEDSLDFSLS